MASRSARLALLGMAGHIHIQTNALVAYRCFFAHNLVRVFALIEARGPEKRPLPDGTHNDCLL